MLQLHKKYPLYGGTPVSFYQDEKGHLVGLTPAVDPLAIFKKNSAFTKPLNEILDEQITPLQLHKQKCLTAFQERDI
jgi:hypothetical protein